MDAGYNKETYHLPSFLPADVVKRTLPGLRDTTLAGLGPEEDAPTTCWRGSVDTHVDLAPAGAMIHTASVEEEIGEFEFGPTQSLAEENTLSDPQAFWFAVLHPGV